MEVSFFAEVHLREITVLGAHQPKTPDEADLYYPWSKVGTAIWFYGSWMKEYCQTKT